MTDGQPISTDILKRTRKPKQDRENLRRTANLTSLYRTMTYQNMTQWITILYWFPWNNHWIEHILLKTLAFVPNFLMLQPSVIAGMPSLLVSDNRISLSVYFSLTQNAWILHCLLLVHGHQVARSASNEFMLYRFPITITQGVLIETS